MRRNGGLWCLNVALLEDKLCRDKLRSLLSALCDESEFAVDLIEWWERAKVKIRGKCIVLGREKRLRDRKEELELRDRMREELELAEVESDRPLNVYLELREWLRELDRRKCRGAMIRSRAQHMLKGERCTAFFLGLEKRRQARTYISGIADAEGKVQSDIVDILHSVQEFYTTLFSKQNGSQGNMGTVLGKISRTISHDDAAFCDGEIHLADVRAAITALNKSKSPGSDGLSAEFYQLFGDLLAPILCRLFTAMQRENRCAETFLRGVITLVYKNKGVRTDLANYRPISLLNTDYKILAKVLGFRLRGVIGSIIGPTQTYSIPGRDIADCILSTRFSFDNLMTTGGVYVGVDLEKAFDRVRHDFLFGCLEVFGFGTTFRGWVELLYSRATSVVKCNGFLTDPFPLERSVRQGCPLSAMLYAIVAEPLAQSIITDTLITGITSPKGSEFKIAQYADDISIMVRDRDSLRRVLQHLEAYEQAAGARINKSKSVMIAGPGVDLGDIEWGVRRGDAQIKVLGIYISAQQENSTRKTWEELIAWCKATLGLWKMRALGLKGKVTIVNAVIVPKLVYAMQVCHVPSDVLVRLSDAIRDFLWKAWPIVETCPLFQEAAEAWSTILPRLECVLTSKWDVWNQPIFGNPRLGGRVGCFMGRGILAETLHQVRDLLNQEEAVDPDVVFCKVKAKGYNINRGKIKSFCDRIWQCMPQNWKERLQETKSVQVGDGRVEFSLMCDIKHRKFVELLPKFWYMLLRDAIFKQPMAHLSWVRIFPTRPVSDIWVTLHQKWLPPAVLNSNYLLRHRRVLVSVVLHQISKEKYE
ncbi:hypothetical protein Q8A73_010385 [Channa argus]|nr:hypothetical protein Q8A73_010385 [Channa argus]